MIVAREAAKDLGLAPSDVKVAVQGLGNVGGVAAQLMDQSGCSVIAVSDRRGGLYDSKGLDISAIFQWRREHGGLADYPKADAITNQELLELPCVVLLPAALEGQIRGDNAHKVRAQIIVEWANGPTTPEADEILRGRGINAVPDILANAGGVLVSYFEWVQDLQAFFWEEDEVNQRLERALVKGYKGVVALAQKRDVSLRAAALMLGVQRVVDAMDARGLYP